jgi:hypothetical protein
VDNPLYAITAAIAVLTVFLVVSNALRYAGLSNFARTRLSMTLFFWFIVATLTIAFGDFALATLPYTIPAFCGGVIVGYLFGVREAEQKLRAQGLAHYMEHFAHIHATDFKKLSWWSFVNFYSVAGALFLINLVGLSRVIFETAPYTVVRTSAVGAFLLGTIFPYLAHLWSIKTPHQAKSTTSDK